MEGVEQLDKTAPSAAAALGALSDGSSIAVGGFGLSGVPDVLIDAVLDSGARNLTVVSNNCGSDGLGLGRLLAAHRVSYVLASYLGNNREFERQFLSGELQVELIPQGSLAERLRAGGCGVAAFYTPTGVGTQVAEGGLPWHYDGNGNVDIVSPAKETRLFNGRLHLLETAITTDFALVHAAVADTHGNLVFHASARNFNPIVAMAGHTTIVEAEQVVHTGFIDPDSVHLPGIFVHRVVALTATQASAKPIEILTTRPSASGATT